MTAAAAAAAAVAQVAAERVAGMAAEGREEEGTAGRRASSRAEVVSLASEWKRRLARLQQEAATLVEGLPQRLRHTAGGDMAGGDMAGGAPERAAAKGGGGGGGGGGLPSLDPWVFRHYLLASSRETHGGSLRQMRLQPVGAEGGGGAAPPAVTLTLLLFDAAAPKAIAALDAALEAAMSGAAGAAKCDMLSPQALSFAVLAPRCGPHLPISPRVSEPRCGTQTGVPRQALGQTRHVFDCLEPTLIHTPPTLVYAHRTGAPASEHFLDTS